MSTNPARIRGAWFKSSYSGEGGNACLEALYEGGQPICVRDSKQLDESGGYPVLSFSQAAWSVFTAHASGR
ncbi:DUF397 domain-containing protein [Streptomyces sp. NPDC001436]